LNSIEFFFILIIVIINIVFLKIHILLWHLKIPLRILDITYFGIFYGILLILKIIIIFTITQSRLIFFIVRQYIRVRILILILILFLKVNTFLINMIIIFRFLLLFFLIILIVLLLLLIVLFFRKLLVTVILTKIILFLIILIILIIYLGIICFILSISPGTFTWNIVVDVIIIRI
jgi:hypothetical protein